MSSACGGTRTVFGLSLLNVPLNEFPGGAFSPSSVALAETSPAPEYLSGPAPYQSVVFILACTGFAMEEATTPAGQPAPRTHCVPDGASSGRWSTSRAATPATYGLAMDVPE